MNPECPPRTEGETCGYDAIQYVGDCDEGLECVSGYCSVTYDEPNPVLMDSLRSLLTRDASESRFDKAGKRVRDIIVESKPIAKNGLGLEYHPDIAGNLQDMKRMWKSGYTENRFAKMVTKWMEIVEILTPTTTEPFIVRG